MPRRTCRTCRTPIVQPVDGGPRTYCESCARDRIQATQADRDARRTGRRVLVTLSDEARGRLEEISAETGETMSAVVEGLILGRKRIT